MFDKKDSYGYCLVLLVIPTKHKEGKNDGSSLANTSTEKEHAGC